MDTICPQEEEEEEEENECVPKPWATTMKAIGNLLVIVSDLNAWTGMNENVMPEY